MKKDDGYWQAVGRLAWEIRELSHQSQVPMLRTNPELVAEDLEVATEMCRAVMTPEEIERWEAMDVIFATICETYDVEIGEAGTDIEVKILEIDMKQMALDMVDS